MQRILYALGFGVVFAVMFALIGVVLGFLIGSMFGALLEFATGFSGDKGYYLAALAGPVGGVAGFYYGARKGWRHEER